MTRQAVRKGSAAPGGKLARIGIRFGRVWSTLDDALPQAIETTVTAMRPTSDAFTCIMPRVVV
jgi:hypothetical protein